jgi:hypothetical protein
MTFFPSSLSSSHCHQEYRLKLNSGHHPTLLNYHSSSVEGQGMAASSTSDHHVIVTMANGAYERLGIELISLLRSKGDYHGNQNQGVRRCLIYLGPIVMLVDGNRNSMVKNLQDQSLLEGVYVVEAPTLLPMQ